MKNTLRPPIVTVLGHVDHGKTSLLDAIRKSNIALKEEGGITQSTGASSVTTKSGKKITFIDTPGHAAFAKMRSRGANVADVALLIVASNDGVKPQTIEALNAIKEAKVPFIVVATKTDLPESNVDQMYGQLEKESVFFEGRGGDTPLVKVSAKSNTGLDDLLDMISLIYEVHSQEDKPKEFEAVVIESSKDQRGPVAAVVVRSGFMKVGETLFVENRPFKVRAIVGDNNVNLVEIPEGEAGLVIGFEETPVVGTKLSKTKSNEKHAASAIFQKKPKLAKDEIAVFIKSSNAGSLEALIGSLPPKVVVVQSGVGDVNESDVMSAKALGANIFVFESGVSGGVKKLAETEKIRVERFKIIYELIQRLEEILKQGLVEILGTAEILTSFPFDNKKVAGCKVTTGRISKADNLVLMRKDKELGKIKPTTLKKGKLDVVEVKTGEEFGILFEPQFDFVPGDVILSAKR